MPAKMSNDMPLPMPRSVISSPIHMTRAAPAVITRTMITSEKMEELEMISWPTEQPWSSPPLAASATMLVACRMASAIAR